MKRVFSAIALAICCLTLAASARAQMGMDLFSRPAFSKIFNPVVGNGAVYQQQSPDSKSPAKDITMFVVGKEAIGTQEGWWLEFISQPDESRTFVGKVLFSKDDFQVHKMVMQMPGRPAMEMLVNPRDSARQKIQEGMNDWHTVGTESVTVPAGTFSCTHWRNDKNNSDIWVSDKISPFGLVKETGQHSNLVLVKVLTGEKDHITGPVEPFDPQKMQMGRPPKQ